MIDAMELIEISKTGPQSPAEYLVLDKLQAD